ncbi:MAG: histidine phosphatase family protein [Armatimonadetes bacterium]|nr:histidine phosphatase family protein [Armatimonadota bacterium]
MPVQTLYLIRHPGTLVDKHLPSSEWKLSEEGGRQLDALLNQAFWARVRHVYSSSEEKAVVVAHRAAEVHGVPFSLHDELRELRRAGFVVDYDGVVARVFETPAREVNGWESLDAARGRVWDFLQEVAARGPLAAAVVSHGLVLSAVRAQLLGLAAPDPTEWRQLPFAGVAQADVSKWQLLQDFAAPTRGTQHD